MNPNDIEPPQSAHGADPGAGQVGAYPLIPPPSDPTLQFDAVDPAGGPHTAAGSPPGGSPPPRRPLAIPQGFRGGLLVGLAVAAVAGLVAWIVMGSGGSAQNSAAAGASATGYAPPTNLPTGELGVPAPSATKTKGKKASKTAAPDYTPGGAQPALVAAASLPGVTSADPSVTCPAATVTVSTSADLTQALAAAAPGTVIQLADGTYSGNFSSSAAGSSAQPIFLCGSTNAVLDAGSKSSSGGYVFHLQNAAFWRLVGFTVQDGQKGVVLDHTDYSVIQGLTVQQVGDEAVHLREFSDDNLVLNNTVRDTGSLNPKFGEGIYIGTAQSNWCTYTACQQDHSDNNVVRGNTVSATTAESVDIKEGTTGGALIGNNFDGAGFSSKGASGWVNAKGNGYLIKGNTGRNSYQDGFQTHQILAGWGQNNLFEGNTAIVGGSGYGFHFTPVNGNVWTCDNTVQSAAAGKSNIACSTAP